MSIRAMIIEFIGGNENNTVGRGEFDFVQLPQRGDRIVLGNVAGGLDIMSVRQLEHSPRKTNPSFKTKSGTVLQPDVTVFVELLDVDAS